MGSLHAREVFQAQGFDSWDAVLDITEADLEALGVKLGHRRKLQRRIAHSRGVPTNAALPTCSQNGHQDSPSLDSEQGQTFRKDDGRETAVAKRRYRRHPKPDKNAPERAPSAYVLFSNKTREELKGQFLSFTEIAKIVGGNWQRIPKEKREHFESQAQQAKERYRYQLAEYKKTPEHEKYAQYLQDFKKKQQARGRVLPDPSRSSASRMGRSHCGSASSNGSRMGRSHCDSASSNGTARSASCLEPEPARQEGRGPISAPVEAREKGIQPSESPVSPRTMLQSPAFEARNISSVAQGGPRGHQKLPSLSDVLDNRADGGTASTSPQRSAWGRCPLSGRSAMPHEQAGSGGSPVFTGSGHAVSGSETDAFPIQPHTSSNEGQSAYNTAPIMQSQPLLAYERFR